jgi:uncharacterized repeat protein (TIGR03803 family)
VLPKFMCYQRMGRDGVPRGRWRANVRWSVAHSLHVCGWIAQIRATWVSPRLALALSLALSLSLPLPAQTFSVLHKFRGGTDGAQPQAGLTRDAAGNLYGTTPYGGKRVQHCSYGGDGCGTVFKIDTNGHETILYRFTGMSDGAQPMSGLIMDGDGNLYGTTYLGGASGVGTVFKIDASGKESVLYSFGSLPDGEYPSGGLVVDAQGNLYGTTEEGGTSESCWGGCGTLFKLDRSGEETVLLNFEPPAESPRAALTIDATGNLYGTTSATVFETRKDIAAAISVYTFTGGARGEGPTGGVIRDLRGDLYGMTAGGGDLNCPNNPWGTGCGLVYEISPRSGKESVLHTFAGTPEGAIPNGGLLRDSAGSLYGTTMFGGSSDFGTVFKLDEPGRMTVLHSFAKIDGALPQSTLIQDASGNLYGTATWGGDSRSLTCGYQHGCGVVFKITP